MKIKQLCAILLTAILSVTMLTACSDSMGGRLQRTSDIADGTVINTVTIGNQTIEWVNYTDPGNYFTARVPKGWKVETNDLYNGASSPASGMSFTVTSADSSFGMNYTDFAAYKSAALTSLTLETLLKEMYFNPAINTDNATLAIQSNTPSGQSTIGFSSDNTGATISMLDSATIRFTLKGGEGEISGSVYKYLATTDAFYVKDVAMYLAPAGQLDQWISVLRTIRASITFTQTYQQRFQKNTAQTNNGGAVAGAYSIGNGTVGGTTGGIGFDMSDSYAARQKSQDIYNEKFKDYILGNERMQDNSTGTIYNTDPSFYQDYQDADGKRYSPITDDQYLQDTSGTIGW